jgi:hypothetical protein
MNNPHNYDYEIQGEISYIYLYQRNGRRHTVIIDAYNLEKVLNYKYKWIVSLQKRNPEVVNHVRATVYLGVENGKIKNRPILLHHFLVGSELEDVDHINNNQLDNRDKNLRHTMQPDNDKNRRGKNRNNKSGYRNVCWIYDCWRIQLQINGVNYRFPEKFDDVDEAGRFAKEMRQKYYGEYAGND